MSIRFLTALPVFNEVAHVSAVLDEVLRYSAEVLVVDDGSTDGTAELLAQRKDIRVVRHETNQGYGAALRSAYEYAIRENYEVLVTIDCDGQHEPQRIGEFVAACQGVDIVSGSRYLKTFDGDSIPPEQRRAINMQLTREVNQRLGLKLTDAFCGFKAYRVAALRDIELVDTGYAMPLEFWVQAASLKLKIDELPVPLIYLDENRSFGGSLDNAKTRLEHYRQVFEQALQRANFTGPAASSDLCDSKSTTSCKCT